MPTSVSFWIVAIIAVAFVGIAKGGFAGGVGVIATPLMALVMPVPEAAALLLPILIAADFMNTYHYRTQWDRPNIRLLLPAGIVGVVIGGLFFSLLADNERVMKMGIGLLALSFVAYQALRALRGGGMVGYKPSKLIGTVMGVSAGFTSTLVHAGGPPLGVYLIPQQLPRQTYVATAQIFFLVINLVKLIPYAILGLLTIGNLKTAVVLIPVAFIGLQVGQWLNRRFEEKWFLLFIYTLLLLTGIQLVLGRNLLSFLL